MKKVTKSVPLIISLCLLASCSTSVDSTSSGNSGAGLQERLDSLSTGFEIEVSVNGQLLGSAALNDEGAYLEYSGDDREYFAPVSAEDEDGDSDIFIAEAHLGLSNEIETDISSYTWESIFTNIFSVLSENDFELLSSGIYSAGIEEGSDLETYAIYQLSLGAANDASEIRISLEDGSFEIELITSGDTYSSVITASGNDVDTSIAAATGDSIQALDDAFSSLEALDYTVTEKYAFWSDTENNYVVNEDYTSWIEVDDGTYAVTSDGEGYVAWTSGDTYGVEYLENTWAEGYWFYGVNLSGITLTEFTGLIETFDISSLLFEETSSSGIYVLRNDVENLVADLSFFDPFDNGLSASSLTVKVDDDSIVFTALVSDELQITVTYSDIGSTSTSINAFTDVYLVNMRGYFSSLYSYYDYLADSIGTSDTNLWYEAFAYVPLPVYGFDGVELDSSSKDTFTGSTYSVIIDYDYYSRAYSYFQQYLIGSGYVNTYETGADGESYYTLTYQFDYSYTSTDEDGNETTVTEPHTVSLIRLGSYYTDNTYTSIDVCYLLTIDAVAAEAAE